VCNVSDPGHRDSTHELVGEAGKLLLKEADDVGVAECTTAAGDLIKCLIEIVAEPS